MGFSDSERADLREAVRMDVSPRDFGRLEAEVAALQGEVQALRSDVRALLALADKSRGGLWVGMSIVSALGGVVGWAAGYLFNR